MTEATVALKLVGTSQGELKARKEALICLNQLRTDNLQALVKMQQKMGSDQDKLAKKLSMAAKFI